MRYLVVAVLSLLCLACERGEDSQQTSQQTPVSQQSGRVLDDAFRTELTTKLPAGRDVAVYVAAGDKEAFNLASEVHTFLKKQKYNVRPLLIPTNMDMLGETKTGTEIQPNLDHMEKAAHVFIWPR